MSIMLRALCVVGAAITFFIVARRVHKARVRLDDAIFWILLSFGLLVIAVFPQIPYALAAFFGFQATSNFVFCAVIVLLLLREFHNTLKISALSSRLDELVQEQALQAKAEEERGGREQ